jgi:hypothetical protein
MKKVKTIGCEEALRHLFTYLDRELGLVKQREVEHHLKICRSCFSRAQFEKRLKTRLREIGRESIRSSFDQRIKKLLNRF